MATDPGEVQRLGRLAAVRLPRLHRHGWFALAGAATGALALVVIFLLFGALPRAPGASAGPVATPGRPSLGGSGGSVSAAQPPLDIAQLYATAEAIYTRTPAARGKPGEESPPPKPAEKPAVAAKADAQPVEKPVEKPLGGPGAGAPPPKPGVVAKPLDPTKPAPETPKPAAPTKPAAPVNTPTPEPTEPPTRTPTVTRTASATATSTPTVTLTPIPSPCTVPVRLPRIGVGAGYFVTFFHESEGSMAVTWRGPTGGRILFYLGRPPELPAGDRGVFDGVPFMQTIGRGTAGEDPLNLPERTASEYTALFFNASSAPLEASQASLTYLTHGRCP